MSELRTRFAEIFGSICSVPDGGSRSAAVEVSVTKEVFEKLMERWTGMEQSSLPRLRGITVSRETSGRKVQILIDAGVKMPIVLMSVSWPSGPFPTLRGIWPYCAWWEMELVRFDSFELSGAREEEGLAWRQG